MAEPAVTRSAIGFHVSKSGRPMHVAIKDIDSVRQRGMTPCAQIFVTGPQSNKETLTAEDKVALRQLTAPGNTAAGTRLTVHGAYIDNPWGSVSDYSIGNICAEMEIAATIGATGVIVHLSNATNAGLDAVLARLSERLSPAARGVILWLETHATKSTANSFETPAKLAALFRRIHAIRRAERSAARHGSNAAPTLPQIGLCIDSAHLHACGTNLRDYAPTARWLADMVSGIADGDQSVPIMVHLNDSASALGSGIDKHAALTRGKIWGDFGVDGRLPIEGSGLMAILEWSESIGADVILERDVGTEDDLDLIQELGYFMRE